MTLDIRAGMFAVLRAGIVPEWPIHRGHTLKWYWMLHDDCYLVSGHWLESKKPHPRDIVATFATRAEALAYVAENPMNRENYPDGPDLAPAPVVMDWKARAEAAKAAQLSDHEAYYFRTILRRLNEMRSAVNDAIQDGDAIHGLGSEALDDEIDWLDCWLDARTRAVAAAKEPRHE